MRCLLPMLLYACLGAVDIDFPDVVADVVHQGEATDVKVCTVDTTVTEIDGKVPDGIKFISTYVMQVGYMNDGTYWMERQFIFQGLKVGFYRISIVMLDQKRHEIGRKTLELSVIEKRGAIRDKHMTDSALLLMPSHEFKKRDTNKNPAE